MLFERFLKKFVQNNDKKIQKIVLQIINAFFDKNEQIIYNKKKLVIDYLEGDLMDIDEFFEKVVKNKIK